MRLRIFSELLPYETVSSRRVLNLLRSYGVELIVAVTPDTLHQLGQVMRAVEKYEVRTSVWPMLSREEGRWLNVATADMFGVFVKQIYELAKRDEFRLAEVLFDLEPTFDEMVAAIDRPSSAKHFVKVIDENRARLKRVHADFEQLCSMLREGGVALSSALVPMVATSHDVETWRALLGIPEEPVDASKSVMLYTSLLEGWSRGAVSRGDALGLLRCGADAAVARWGNTAEVAVGLVGPGIFGNEPCYRTPDELAEDVAIVRASGARSIALFDLGGILLREPAEAWLEALFVAENRGFAPALRARLLWAGLGRVPALANVFATFFRSRP